MTTHNCHILLWTNLLACANSGLVPVCPEECYTLTKGKGGVGECKSGTPQCDDAGKVIRCMGQSGPELEVCDGKDNDCDEETDEYPQKEIACPSLGVCSGVSDQCLLGEWYCTGFPDTYQVSETICDILDNDCDGFVDNNLFVGEYCYSGPAGSSINSPCHPGTYVCASGQKICVNEQTPGVEICDQIDNDCNGLTDDLPLLASNPVDFALILDASGSMDAEIGAVVAALGAFAASHPSTLYKFAILNMCNGIPTVFQNFEDAATTATKIATFPGPGVSCSAENSLGTQYHTCSDLNPYNLTWRTDSTRIILGFTDENGQFYNAVPIPSMAEQIQECQESGTKCYWWHLTSVSDFIPFCAETGGTCFELTNSAATMLEDLNQILEDVCQ